jgi:hypothetical protein
MDALVLTDEEWKDLGYIARVFRLATENTEGYSVEEMPTVLRRRSLAERVIAAADE